MTTAVSSAGARFRAALAAESPLQVIGAINANHALLAKRAGYRAIYLSGGGVAAGSLGLPDLGINTLEDVLIDVRRITDVCDLLISRQQSVSPRPLDVNEAIAATLPGLSLLADENIELEIDREAGPMNVFADPNQIERVLSILIANARDAMPKGGKLTISTAAAPGADWKPVAGTAEEPAYGPAGHVILTVRDTGCGMTDEIKARLFEPFFTNKPVGKGAGLGLSTVYGIIKSGGGDIQVESAPGKGTAFRLILPRLENAAPIAAAIPANTAESRAGAETVLLVEDDEDVRFLLSSILKAEGYSVLEAKDGEQALQMAASHPGPINLVLTDLQMPRLGGRRLVETLLPANPGMKAMFMSGFGREDFPDASAQGSSVTFLEKPFMPKSLVRQIRKVLDA